MQCQHAPGSKQQCTDIHQLGRSNFTASATSSGLGSQPSSTCSAGQGGAEHAHRIVGLICACIQPSRASTPPAAHAQQASSGRRQQAGGASCHLPTHPHHDPPAQQLAKVGQRQQPHAGQRRSRRPLLLCIISPVSQVQLPPAGVCHSVRANEAAGRVHGHQATAAAGGSSPPTQEQPKHATAHTHLPIRSGACSAM